MWTILRPFGARAKKKICERKKPKKKKGFRKKQQAARRRIQPTFESEIRNLD